MAKPATGDPAVEAAALIFEARLCVEAVAFGLSRMMGAVGSARVDAELDTLRRMANQGGDALEALQKTLMLVPPEGQG